MPRIRLESRVCQDCFWYTAPAMSFTVRRVSSDRRPIPATAKKALTTAAAAVTRPFAPEEDKNPERAAEREEAKHKRVGVLKKIIVILVAVLCVTLVVAAVVNAVFGLRLLSVKSVVFMAGADLPVDRYGHTNVLLLGQGDKGHSGVDLTDSIIIASIDPGETKSLSMFSLPRDLWFTSTENMGSGRVNTLYRDYKSYLWRRQGLPEAEAEQLGMKELGAELGRKLGIDIHGVIKVDFTGFVSAVDTLGGVTLDVPYDIVDREYPGENYSYETFIIRKGVQQLDGETALKYARSRHTTSDFSRSARQQQLLGALGKKVQEEGLLKSPGTVMTLMNILGEHVRTTFELRELIGLAKLGSEIDRKNINSAQLTDYTGNEGGFLYPPPREMFGGASVLLPAGGSNGWENIQAYVMLSMHLRAPVVAPAVVDVINAGATSGLGRRLGIELIQYGFDVDRIENAPDDAPDEPFSYVAAARNTRRPPSSSDRCSACRSAPTPR